LRPEPVVRVDELQNILLTYYHTLTAFSVPLPLQLSDSFASSLSFFPVGLCFDHLFVCVII